MFRGRFGENLHELTCGVDSTLNKLTLAGGIKKSSIR